MRSFCPTRTGHGRDTDGNASVKLGNRGILFNNKKHEPTRKNFMGNGFYWGEFVVHPMNFFRVVSVFRCKKIPLHSASLTDYS